MKVGVLYLVLDLPSVLVSVLLLGSLGAGVSRFFPMFAKRTSIGKEGERETA
jgi:hypothetical protein